MRPSSIRSPDGDVLCDRDAVRKPRSLAGPLSERVASIRDLSSSKEQDAAFRSYVQDVTTSSAASPAAEIANLADLRDKGVISDAEFQQAKAKALS